MAVKLMMKYDIKPGREQEFFEFQVREWVPGLQRLGLEPTDHWYTMYGRLQPLYREIRRITGYPR